MESNSNTNINRFTVTTIVGLWNAPLISDSFSTILTATWNRLEKNVHK